LKRLVWSIVKIAVSLGILALLAVQAQRNNVFEDLLRQPKHWGLLAAACGLCFAAVSITLVRWYWLVRALDLPIRLNEAFRLGLLGYLFNLAPMGIVGGDLLKAVMLARRHPGRRAEAVVTVFMDRLIGLYVLFLVAATAILVTGLWRTGTPDVRLACRAALALAAAGTVFVAVLLLPDASQGKTIAWCGRLPYVGRVLKRLIESVRMYRFRLGTLAVSALATVAVHSLFTVAVYLIARGLFDPAQPLAAQFVVYPLSAVTKVLPINLGPFEAVFNLFYAEIPLIGAAAGEGQGLLGQGLVVALCYRIIELLVAAIGLVYYLSSRREVAEAMEGNGGEEDG
jgi:glycosyltransferase 2 family protein